jgi:tetratricopeptide (TPR) repeat protein
MDRLLHLWDFADLDASESRLREQLASEPDADGRAEVLTQLARIEGLRDEFAAAERLLVEADELASSDVAKARIDLERGRALRSGGDDDAAYPLFVAAYDRALAASQDFIAGDAAHMAAIVDPSWAERGIALAESSEEARYWLGPLWNNLGWSRFERAFAVSETPRERAIARYAIARALRELGRLAEAIDQLEVALAQSPGPHPVIEEELTAMRAAVRSS